MPTVLPIGGWRCDCRPRGRLAVNGALGFERLEHTQHGDVMHGESLEDEPVTVSAAARGRDESSRATMRLEKICLQAR